MDIKSLALGILKPIAFVLRAICMWIILLIHQSHVAYGMESGVKIHLPDPAAFKHFEEDKDLIHQYLSKVGKAELHFFWTTGRTLSDNSDYHPNTKVDVGGVEYGQKFFPYVNKLLEITPKNLTVVFVCDGMTEISNEKEINALEKTYKNRFKVVPVSIISERLLKVFPTQSEKIKIVFINATQGIPVLTSDIYRVIGMVYGAGFLKDVEQKQFTYSDIDAFCYGMESLSHTKLIAALFNPVTKLPFYFGMSPRNNDVIKLHISDLEAYKAFCERILQRVNIHANVFTHFSILHDTVKQCEKDSQNCTNLVAHLPPPIQNLVFAVTLATGPNFLYDTYITDDLSYPYKTTGEWSAPEELLDNTMQRYSHTHPPSVLFWGYDSAFPGREEASEAFIRDCDQYRTVLSAAFYAKRFGDHHPFNIAIKQHLVDHFPYHATSFKELLKVNFAFHNRLVKRNIKQVYTLVPLEYLRVGRSPTKNYIYLNIQDNKLHYTFAGSNENTLKGTFDFDISDDIESIEWQLGQEFSSEEFLERIIGRYKDQLFDEALQKGLIHKPEDEQLHLSYNDWKEKAFKDITGSSHNYYAELTHVLKKLGIEIPFTPESLGFQGQISVG